MIKKTFEELKLTGQLPSPPGVGMKILKLTQGEDFSADEIGRTIMADAALTGRLLKIANSAQSAGARPVTTVSEATMRLGVRAVRNVALGLSLISSYRAGACSAFSYDRYWSLSLARAVAAQSISRAMRIGQPPEAYILGLLSDIGTLALVCVYPEEYASLLASTGGNRRALREAERKRFEIDHAEVGSYMLEEWGLPTAFADAIQHYEERTQSREETDLTRILRHANCLAEVCLTTEGEKVDWASLASGLERMRTELGLAEEAFNEFCNAIIREWVEWGATLKVPAQKGVDIARIALLAAQQPLPTDELVDASALVDGTPSSPSGGTSVVEGSKSDLTQEARVPQASLRILAVDDDAMSLRLLERQLTKAGHKVLCARDGNEGLQLALETNPQVVIADWMMPGLSGLELCRSLRRIESGRDIFFLLLTGRDEEDRVVEAFDAGVDDFIAKPFNARILMARIKGGQRVIELKEQVETERRTVRSQVAELGVLTRKLRTAALTDVLTELPNRRYAMKKLEQEWDSSIRNNRPLSLIMIDIDHFKKVNDVHGHDIGDVVLKETANVLRTTARQGEEPARLGGEEFLVLCPNTSLVQAKACAERLRAAIEANKIRGGSFDGHVTASLGVAERTADTATPDALIKCADEAVYAAKSGGRNRVCASPSLSTNSTHAKAG
ncbi:MAG: HDOD domain-containing protein [Planctomycetes bacterium]|nr:HDOD domain-containing protein [Planctomycetota bacterium]